MDIKSLSAAFLNVSVKGRGDIKVLGGDVIKQKININGSGNVTYSGDPKKIEQKVSGSGNIQKSLR